MGLAVRRVRRHRIGLAVSGVVLAAAVGPLLAASAAYADPTADPTPGPTVTCANGFIMTNHDGTEVVCAGDPICSTVEPGSGDATPGVEVTADTGSGGGGTVEATDQPTDVATDVSTDQPTDVATDQPTELATDQPTELATDQPTDVATDEPTDLPTEVVTDPATTGPLVVCVLAAKFSNGGAVGVGGAGGVAAAADSLPLTGGYTAGLVEAGVVLVLLGATLTAASTHVRPRRRH